MSRTIKGSKGCGWEFWSKRPMNGWVGKWAKKKKLIKLSVNVTRKILSNVCSINDPRSLLER